MKRETKNQTLSADQLKNVSGGTFQLPWDGKGGRNPQEPYVAPSGRTVAQFIELRVTLRHQIDKPVIVSCHVAP